MAERILTCTWAPTELAVPQLLRGPRIDLGLDELAGNPLASPLFNNEVLPELAAINATRSAAPEDA